MGEKNVLVVGGSGGIGSHIVEEFKGKQWEVISTFFGNRLKNADGGAYRLDSTNEEDCENLTRRIKERYGKLNALIYASGIFEDSLTEKTEIASWNRVLNINLTGAFLITKHMLPLLRESGDGRILYIGSVMGDAGCYGSSSYSVTKAGLVALAKSVALENATKGVTANVLSFGYIDTGMTASVPQKVLEGAMKKIPMKRLGDPSEVARIAVDLCSEHMNYVSGQVIRANGALYV